MAFDFLVVTYDKDLHFLEMQARSIAEFFDYDDISSITIVHNNLNGSRTPIDINIYGKFKDKVNEVVFNDFQFMENKIDYGDPLYGWIRQQFCKLYFASFCRSEWCYVVDSKTIFLRKFQKEKHFTDQGKNFWYVAWITDYFFEGNNWTERFFELEPSHKEAMIPRRGTPIMMHVPSIRNLIVDLYWKTKISFFEWFIINQKKYNVSEFDLYFTYLRYTNTTNDLYEFLNLNKNVIVEDLILLRGWADPEKFDIQLDRIHNQEFFTISAHQEILDNLTEDQFNRLYAYFTEKKIFVMNNG